MLDIKTKNTIDSARNILVGKIPNPSFQVEQITLAMLYKFMDDMDQEGMLLGGKPTFFAGDFEQYSWKKIMSKTVSAQDRYNKYTEALERFYNHPNLPQTFKDVFKNASVPFKEADILTMFLKEIDTGLSYDDSEQLGDAYEYLLSVLGSQGDLGQFRTPRHIIDMMVEIVDPKKTDTILDPACGTAGFLISAYKHIIKENTDKTPGDKMNFDERMEVLRHITGYDIEPSMVRIAEMNMFLHGATDPDIHEYDTLKDDSKWDEKFNVILANPPFMTPKGGIKPHSKFSIKANRSEILFVDFILNHLRMEGRAGIIVPDGVVSINTLASFKEVRRKLVDIGLVAVVAMPRGIFNPYSPIKTCILVIDKKLAKEKKDILFIELNNDGYSLGAQRVEIAGNEIPEVTRLIKEYLSGKEVTDEKCVIVDKEKILATDEVSLSIKKYKEYEEIIMDEDPKEIIAKIDELERKGNQLIAEIRGLI